MSIIFFQYISFLFLITNDHYDLDSSDSSGAEKSSEGDN